MAELLLISQSRFLCRVAICADGKVVEYRDEERGASPLVGSVFRARVSRIHSGQAAAFVDYGGGDLGYLPLDEVSAESLSINQAPETPLPLGPFSLKQGQEVLVQLIRAGDEQKGARLTGKFSFPGRYWVYLPTDEPEIFMSRRLGNEGQRDRLRSSLDGLLEDRGAMIVRNAATMDRPEEMKAELEALRKKWKEVLHSARAVKSGERVYGDDVLALRAIRESVSKNCERILVDDPDTVDSLRGRVDNLLPDLRGKIELDTGRPGLFERFGIEAALAESDQRKISLPGGGTLAFDLTEAMVVVDVNAGNRASGKGREQTHVDTNMEAAIEIARQVRLRDLTGIIVVDFINMRSEANQKRVVGTLRSSFRNDPVRCSVVPMSSLGLVQMVRSASGRSTRVSSTRHCGVCRGSGSLPGLRGTAFTLLHELERLLLVEKVREVCVEGDPELIEYLRDDFGHFLDELQSELHKGIVLCSNGDYDLGTYSLGTPNAGEPDNFAG